MPLPPDLKTITVTGSYVDGSGNAIAGTVDFIMPVVLNDPANNKLVIPKTFTATLASGAFSIVLPATDDPDLSPQGWTYTVIEKFAGGRTFELALPYNTPGDTLDLADVFVGQDKSTGTVVVISGGAATGSSTPLALGSAAAGSSSLASKQDHIHPLTGVSQAGHGHTSSEVSGVANQATIDTSIDAHNDQLLGAVAWIVHYNTGTSTWPGRPAGATTVFAIGGPSQPAWLTSTDVWIKPDVTGTATFLAEYTFEGYADNEAITTIHTGSGTKLDTLTVPTGATAIAKTGQTVAGAGDKFGRFTTGTTAGACSGAWKQAIGTLTACVFGGLFRIPAAPGSNANVLRIRRWNSGTSVFEAAANLRINASRQVELYAADGAVKFTSTALVVLNEWYWLELEVDCVNSHLRGWMTRVSTGVEEAIGNFTAVHGVNTQLDDYTFGDSTNLTSFVTDVDTVRVGPGGTRVKS